jgi:hypothetical protein
MFNPTQHMYENGSDKCLHAPIIACGALERMVQTWHLTMRWRLQGLCNVTKLQAARARTHYQTLSHYHHQTTSSRQASHTEQLMWHAGGKESRFVGEASQVSSFPLGYQSPAASKQASLIMMASLTDTATGCRSASKHHGCASSICQNACLHSQHYLAQMYSPCNIKSLGASRCSSQHKQLQ